MKATFNIYEDSDLTNHEAYHLDPEKYAHLSPYYPTLYQRVLGKMTGPLVSKLNAWRLTRSIRSNNHNLARTYAAILNKELNNK